MANRFFERIMHGPSIDFAAPVAGKRGESMQRLQIGLSGIVGMILLVALADTLGNRAHRTDAATVADAEMPTDITQEPEAQSDPLAEAGVVPDLPADNAEAAAQDAPVLPEQGNASGAAPQTRSQTRSRQPAR